MNQQSFPQQDAMHSLDEAPQELRNTNDQVLSAMVRVDLSPVAIIFCREMVGSSAIGSTTERNELNAALVNADCFQLRHKRHLVFMRLNCATLLAEISKNHGSTKLSRVHTVINRGVLAELRRATAGGLLQLATIKKIDAEQDARTL